MTESFVDYLRRKHRNFRQQTAGCPVIDIRAAVIQLHVSFEGKKYQASRVATNVAPPFARFIAEFETAIGRVAVVVTEIPYFVMEGEPPLTSDEHPKWSLVFEVIQSLYIENLHKTSRKSWSYAA